MRHRTVSISPDLSETDLMRDAMALLAEGSWDCRLSESVSEASSHEKVRLIARAALRHDWRWIEEARAALVAEPLSDGVERESDYG